MKRTPAILLGLIAVVVTAVRPARSESPRTVHTNKQRFAIPFQFDTAELNRLGTKEVRLYVSVDQGASWQHVQSVAPQTRKFFVRAPKDGAYWFAVRTVGRDRREHPSTRRIDPELKVHVDTASPRFQIRLSQPEPGRVELSWSTSDQDVDPQSLSLESMQSGQTKWSKVYVAKKANGSTSWNVASGGVIEVRGRIADRAGNVTMEHARKNIAASGESVPAQPVPDLNQPIASTETPIRKRQEIPDQFPGPRINPRPPEGAHVAGSPAIKPSHTPARTITEQSVHRAGEQAATRTAKPAAANSAFVPIHTPAAEPPQTATPTRIVRNRRFDLGYQVDKVGSSGVRSVELYITQNNGKKWYRYGVDEDRSSPFAVVVPQDGRYGFIIRVRSGAGLVDPPPQPGDRPDIHVIVDRTAPTLKLLPILQGTGDDMNRFLIRWKSTDANPAVKPMTIAYSKNANGPWIPIIQAKANTGHHLWTVGSGVPPRVYLRLTTHDKAGNTAQIQTSRPIIVDLVRPRARITDVNVNPGKAPAIRR